jgi:hypothetical protein
MFLKGASVPELKNEKVSEGGLGETLYKEFPPTERGIFCTTIIQK